MSNSCPHCGTVYPPDTVICVKCGIDLRTGDELQTEAEPEPRPSAIMTVLLFLGNLAPGVVRPMLLITSLLVAVIGLGIMVLGMHIFAMGAVFAAVAILASGLVVYAQAVAWVLFGNFAMLPECLAELDGNQWFVFFIIVLAPIAAFLIALHLASGQAGAG